MSNDKEYIARIVAQLDENSLRATINQINTSLSKVKVDFGKDVFKPLEVQAIVAARTMEDAFSQSIGRIRAEIVSLKKELASMPAPSYGSVPVSTTGLSPSDLARRPAPSPTTRGAGQATASDVIRNIYMELGRAAQTVPIPKQLQTVVDPSNARNRFLMQYELAELSSLVPSTSAAYRGLQPRPADTAASEQRIREIKAKLDAALVVFRSPFANVGAPIVDPLNMLISGSHRITAMQQLASENPARFQAEYGEYLRQNAEQFGFSPDQLSAYRNPVLIQRPAETMTPDRYKLLAESANRDVSVAQSVSIKAQNDAFRISAGAIANMNAAASNSLYENIAQSRQLITEVINALPTSERAGYQTVTGGYTQGAIERVADALFARVFPGNAGKELIKTFSEEPDAESPVKRIENALMKALPGIARVQALSGVGSISPGLDIAPDLADAISNFVKYRRSGLTLSEFTGPTMFEPSKFNETQIKFLELLEENRNRQGVLTEKLQSYVKGALESSEMFQLAKGDLVRRAFGFDYTNPIELSRYQPQLSAPQLSAEQLQAAVTQGVSDGVAQFSAPSTNAPAYIAPSIPPLSSPQIQAPLIREVAQEELDRLAAVRAQQDREFSDQMESILASLSKKEQEDFIKATGYMRQVQQQIESAPSPVQNLPPAAAAVPTPVQAVPPIASAVRILPSGPTIQLPPVGGSGAIPIQLPPAGGMPANPMALIPYPGLGLPANIPGMAGGAGGFAGGAGGRGSFTFGGNTIIPPGGAGGFAGGGFAGGTNLNSVGDIFKAIFGNAARQFGNGFSISNFLAGGSALPDVGSIIRGIGSQFSGLAAGGMSATDTITQLGLTASTTTEAMASGWATVAGGAVAAGAGVMLVGKAYLDAYQSAQQYLKGVGQIQRQLGATAQESSQLRNLLSLTPHGADNPFAAISLTQLQANLQAVSDYENGLIKSNQQLEYFIQGLDRLGISATDAQGNVKSITQIIIDASEALQGLSGGEYTRALQQLTGLFGAVDIAPLIGIDPDLLREFSASAVQVTQQQIKLNMERQIATQSAINAEQQFGLQITESLTPLDIQLQKLKQRAMLIATAALAPTQDQRIAQIDEEIQNNRLFLGSPRADYSATGRQRTIELINRLQMERDMLTLSPEALRNKSPDTLNTLAGQYARGAFSVYGEGATDQISQQAATIYSRIQRELERRQGKAPKVNLFQQMTEGERAAFGKGLGAYINAQAKEIVAAQKTLAKAQADYVAGVSGTVQQIISTGVQYKTSFEKYRDVYDIIERGGASAIKVARQIKEATQAELKGYLGLGGKAVPFPQIEGLVFSGKASEDRKIYKALQDFRLNLEAINRETLEVGIGAFKTLTDNIKENEPAFAALKKSGVDALDALARSAGMFADSGFAASLGEAALQAKLLSGGFGDITDPNKVGGAFATYLGELSNFKQRVVELLPALEGEKLTLPVAVELKLITKDQANLLKDPKALDKQIKALMNIPGDEVAVQADLKFLVDTKNLGVTLTGADPKARTQAIIAKLYQESGLDQATLREAFNVAFELQAPAASEVQSQIDAIAKQVEATKIGVDVELRAKGITLDELLGSQAGGNQLQAALKNNPLFEAVAGALGVKQDALTPNVQLALVTVDVDEVEAQAVADKAETATQEELDNLASMNFTGEVGTITLSVGTINVDQIRSAISNAIDQVVTQLNAPAVPRAPVTPTVPRAVPEIDTDLQNWHGRQLGGYAYGPTLVGERGRELLMGNGGFVLSNTITDRLLNYARGGMLGAVPVARTRSDRAGMSVANISSSNVTYNLNVDARGASSPRAINNSLQRLDVRSLFQSSRLGASVRRARQIRGEL